MGNEASNGMHSTPPASPATARVHAARSAGARTAANGRTRKIDKLLERIGRGLHLDVITMDLQCESMILRSIFNLFTVLVPFRRLHRPGGLGKADSVCAAVHQAPGPRSRQ